MIIQNCEESNVYIDANVDTLLVSSCINCTIFVASVSKICTIEKCEKVTICVAANQVRVGSCIDTIVHSYVPRLSPIVYGDTRSIKLAPHNASYPTFLEHLKRANVLFEIPKERMSDWFTQ